MGASVLLVAFAREQTARLLVTYLHSKQIEANYIARPGQHAHGVELPDAAHLSIAQRLTQEFLRNPDHREYQQLAWQQGQAVRLQSGWQLGKKLHYPSLRETPVTTLVLLICLMTFCLSLLGWFAQVKTWLEIQPLGQLLHNQQWWRLIGPVFIHFSVLHLVFNLLWWWMLGAQIERRLGTRALMLLFLLTAILPNLGQLLMTGNNFGGLSGVVYGLVGFVWWAGWLKPEWGLGLPKAVIGFLLVWLLLGYADVLWVNMANTAHTLGLLVGCCLAYLLRGADTTATKP